MTENYFKNKSQKKDNLAVGAKGGIIAFVFQITALVLGFLNTIILARILGASAMGEVLLALTVVSFSVLVSAFGMQGAMMRFVPLYLEKGENARLKGMIYFVLKFCLALSVIFVILILLLSKFISITVFHSPGLLKLLPVIVIAISANTLNDLIGGILKGYKDTFRALLPASVVSPFFRIAIFLLLSLKGVSALSAIVAFVSGEIIALVFSLIFISKKMNKIKPVYERGEYGKIFGVASTMIFTTLSWFLFTQTDLWIVGMFTSTEEVGIYGIASRLASLIAISLGAFSTIIPPIIASVHTAGDHKELRRVVRESTRWILSTAVPIILIFVLEGKLILELAYGEKFANGYTVLMILSIGQLINAGSGLVGYLLQMTGEHRTFMRISVFFGILNVVLNVMLVPYLGIVGAGLSTAFCLAMTNIVSVFVIYKKMSVLTLAKGLKFDIVFVSIVAIIYGVFNYNSFNLGLHLLLITALIVYITKSVINHDYPWRFLFTKYKT